MKIKRWRTILLFLATTALAIGLISCGGTGSAAQVRGKNITIQFNKMLNSRVLAHFDGRTIQLGDFRPTEFITVGGQDIQNFTLNTHSEKELDAGEGKSGKEGGSDCL
ncbi:MAG: hypothetical protein P8184_19275 [Calditrichia bacterium]